MEDFIDRVLLQGKSVEMPQKDLLPTIMKGIKGDLQKAILHKDPDIASVQGLRKVAVFAQACKPNTQEVVMAPEAKKRGPDIICRPPASTYHRRSQSPYRGHTISNGYYRGCSPSPMHRQDPKAIPRSGVSNSSIQHQQRCVTFNVPGKCCTLCGSRYHRHLNECPARGQLCHACGKINHFAAVCFSTKQY